MVSYNILITGASGFIGKNILASNLFSHHNLYCVVRNQSSIDTLKKINSKIIIILASEIDFLNVNSVKIDCVINLSSYGVSNSSNDIEEMLQTNLIFSAKVLKYAQNSGCTLFLNFGSAFEYGSINANKILTENTFPSPDNLYGSSKFANHIILKNLSSNSLMKFVTLRPFSLYGPYEDKSRIFPTIFYSGTNGILTNLTLGEQVRDYLFINDLIDVLNYLIYHKELINTDILNVCSSSPITLKDFINQIIEINNFDKKLFVFGGTSYRKNESMKYIGSNAKLKNIFPELSLTGLKEGIEKTSKFISNNLCI
jgi:nucleoside-diphosphate-sugar epimerase